MRESKPQKPHHKENPNICAFGRGLHLAHKHHPVKTGRRIMAGYRKNNLPMGTWSVLCEGDEMICECGAAWVLRDETGGMFELEPEPEIHDQKLAVNY